MRIMKQLNRPFVIISMNTTDVKKNQDDVEKKKASIDMKDSNIYHLHINGDKYVLIDYMKGDVAFRNYCRNWIKTWIDDGNDKNQEYDETIIESVLQDHS